MTLCVWREVEVHRSFYNTMCREFIGNQFQKDQVVCYQFPWKSPVSRLKATSLNLCGILATILILSILAVTT